MKIKENNSFVFLGKRWFYLLLVLVCSLKSWGVNGDPIYSTDTADPLRYTVVNENLKTVEVTALSGDLNAETVVIGATVKDRYNKKTYKIIGISIKLIRDEAPFNRIKVVDMSGATNLEYICDECFHRTEKSSLERVVMTGLTSLKKIGIKAFQNAKGSATPGKTISGIDLSHCYSLESIGNYAFEGLTGMSDINLSNSSNLSKIGEGAFRNCDMKQALFSPSYQPTEIPRYLFQNCTGLLSVSIVGTNITRLWASCFSNCSSLTLGQDFLTSMPKLDGIEAKAFENTKFSGELD
ncbi:MAG: leucine-rich repeat domain-containing protein, partial [Muribaculaceae bacterium]|nr:leucine-rich repeat domain-containing protein [Muribaculaceae bacterium]